VRRRELKFKNLILIMGCSVKRGQLYSVTALLLAIEYYKGQQIKIVGILSHKQGYTQETEIILPSDTSGSKNAVQAIGSTISYGRRYVTCALLNISTGDDNDGKSEPVYTDPKKTPLNETQIFKLLEKAKEYGKDAAFICSAAQVQKIGDIQQGRLKAIINHLEKN
jgi:hypothetical protein